MRWPALLALACLAAGCTPMEWVKPDATPDEMNRDAMVCQQEAWREARLRSWYYRPIGPMVAHDAAGRPFVVWPSGPFGGPFDDPFMEEGRLAQFCMRAKGYELVPADKVPRAPQQYMERKDKPADTIQPSPSGTPSGKPNPG
jgi:hypothetical protein